MVESGPQDYVIVIKVEFVVVEELNWVEAITIFIL